MTTLREANDVLTLPFDKAIKARLLNSLCNQGKVILFGGFAGAGTPEIFKNYVYKSVNDGFTVTYWDRGKIFSMISEERTLDKLNAPIAEMEKSVFSEIIGWEDHKVLINAPFLTKRSRRFYTSLAKHNRVVLIFADGPPELREQSLIEEGLDIRDIREVMTIEQSKFEPPSFSEGFSKIYYVNTFNSSIQTERTTEYMLNQNWNIKE